MPKIKGGQNVPETSHTSRVKTKHGKTNAFNPHIKISRKVSGPQEMVGDAVNTIKKTNNKNSELSQNPSTPTPSPVLRYNNG